MLFSTATLTVLRGLKRHTDRAWFEAHRPDFEADVQRPMRHLIEELDVRLARLAPEIIGSVHLIYADVSQDQKTGASYYTVKIDLNDHELARLGNLKLVPGMPVESFIQTGERTALSYFVKPLADQFARTFREN